MNVNGLEFFDDVLEMHTAPNTLAGKYARLRALLERACKDLTTQEPIQFSNFFSRLNFVCSRYHVDGRLAFRINTFRVHSNDILYRNAVPEEATYLQDLKAVCQALSHLYEIPIPEGLHAMLPVVDLYLPHTGTRHHLERVRVELVTVDDQYLYVVDEAQPSEDPIRVRHGVAGVNDAFNETIAQLWKGCQLNLVEVNVDDDGTYVPGLIILEPDYLVDISSLAECMKEYGAHPLNFIQARLEPAKNTRHILLGNIANLFLDEFVNERPDRPVVFLEALRTAFRNAPFEFATCEGVDRDFFKDVELQYHNIRRVVNDVFPGRGIARENAILEPSFICEHLGVQGRLDLLQLQEKGQPQFVIELKSGKAPYPEDNHALVGHNHRSQAFIYQILIQKVLGVAFRDLSTFILYSRYTAPDANLRLPTPYMSAIREVLNVRNGIVANERRIANAVTNGDTHTLISNISPDTLITNDRVSPRFIADYIVPQIRRFREVFETATPLELAYFHSFYAFVTREQYLSKAGDTEYDTLRGISSLWLSSLAEKFEAGEMLTDLEIMENHTAAEARTLKLRIPVYEHDLLHNFRQGDIVILYERNAATDNVTNKQIFKGTIQELAPDFITVRIRYRQRNQAVLPAGSRYAVERDFLDASYHAMYRGLYAFLQANKDRRDLLLHQRKPAQNMHLQLAGSYGSPEINAITLKAKQANDYFLLAGPPGTGKTSRALKAMVEEFYTEPGKNILLLSFTNRAVDEICDALDVVAGSPAYIRIGAELACAAEHRKRLLEHVIRGCHNRDDVRRQIEAHRIFVGTVASLAGKTELFKLKHFEVAIIDEASQILEPALAGLLSAKDGKGGNAIGKFILIGDHKQLPAVVLQKESDSIVNDPGLRQVGLHDRRNSFFERLFHLHGRDAGSPVWGMLHKQGRMHPEIALFPNYAFYNSQLQEVPTPHQTEALAYAAVEPGNLVEQLVASRRLAFIPAAKHVDDKTHKTNTYEARIAATLVKNIYTLYQHNGMAFSAAQTLGIITPYRSQIALIKRSLHALGIPELNEVMVDTVERFQGSERDIIIYSCAVNDYRQLSFLSQAVEVDGQLVDRKLNVAITRARKQLFITGNPVILSNSLTYYRFLEFIRSRGGYVHATPEQFLSGNFSLEAPVHTNAPAANDRFDAVFDDLVATPLHQDPRTSQPDQPLGFDHDHHVLNVVAYGRTQFNTATGPFTTADKVNLYCYYQLRNSYADGLHMFAEYDTYLRQLFAQCNHRVALIDIGCGPMTGGLAFQRHFDTIANFYFHYVGIDVAPAMLDKARLFAASGLLARDTRVQFVERLERVEAAYWESVFTLPHAVVLYAGNVFGSMRNEDAALLAAQVNDLMDKFPGNKYVLIFQGPALEQQARSYTVFKKLVPRLHGVSSTPGSHHSHPAGSLSAYPPPGQP